MTKPKQQMRSVLCALALCLTSAITGAADTEEVFWQSVVKGNAREEYELYLKQYPQGRHVQEARRKIEALREKARAQQEAQNRRQAQAEAAKRAKEEAGRRKEEEAQRRQVEAIAERERAEQVAAQHRAEQEALRPGRVFRDCTDCPELVVIPAGNFMMGSPASEEGRDADESPAHRVELSTFALGRTEVTVGEFRKFVQATGYKTEAENNVRWSGCDAWDVSEGKTEPRSGRYWDNPGFVQTETRPIVCVSWNDSRAYIEWLSKKTGQRYALPSEAQWEYAARGGSTTSRYWGEGNDDACRYANVLDETVGPGNRTWKPKYNCNDQYFFSAPVASYSPNAFGLYDMLGNVWEWVEDCANSNYNEAPTDGSTWIRGNCGMRVMRGGSWRNYHGFVRAAKRAWRLVSHRDDITGFRPARILP